MLFWIIPAISPHMFLMRIRGIAEHGLPNQLGIDISDNRQGNLYTRSFLSARKVNNSLLSWLEKILIGSLDVHYHHEHHLLPNVPHYNLKKVHEKIYQKAIILNPNIFVSGYFKAAFNPENIK